MSETSISTAAPSPASYAHYVLGLLMLASIFSFVDRNIFQLLLTPIQADLKISDTWIAYLQGVPFGLVYAVAAIPFGWVVDHHSRRNLIILAVIAWSIATVFCGLSTSYLGLLIARIAVAVGEAALMPAAMSLLSDFFPPARRGHAFGFFAMASYIGGGGSFIVGGLILNAFRGAESVTLPVFGNLAIWKAAFISVGVPGGVLVPLLVFLTLREPKRTGARVIADDVTGAAREYTGFFAFFVRHWSAFIGVWGSYVLMTFLAFVITPWVNTMMVRKFGMSPGDAGLTVVGPIQIVAGISGCVLAGILGDQWTRQKKVGSRLRLLLIFWIAALPSVLMLTLGDNVMVAGAGFAIYFFFNSLAYAGAFAITQDIVPVSLRGRSTAGWFLVTSVLGMALGPIAAGLVTDYVFHDPAALPQTILVLGIPSIGLGLILALIGLKPYHRVQQLIAAAENR